MHTGEGFKPGPTREEIAKFNKERILSDAELVKGGAEVTSEGIVLPTAEQQTKATLEMGEHFYNKSKQLKLKWWEKSYEGYNIDPSRRRTISKASKWLDNLKAINPTKFIELRDLYKDTQPTGETNFEKVAEDFAKKNGLDKWEVFGALIYYSEKTKLAIHGGSESN